METRYLILVDEQSQKGRLEKISRSLKNDGVQLVYEEINPNDFMKRQDDFSLKFDRDALMGKLDSIDFFRHLDMFATDYNLVGNELKGIDLVKMLYELNPYYHNRVVIYSAQMDGVIKNIIVNRATNLEQQVEMIKLLNRNEVNFLRNENEFVDKFKKLITKEKNLTIDVRLADSLRDIDNGDFMCLIPGYTDKKISEIGNLLLKENEDTISLKKNITQHIMACITSIRDYD